MGAFPNYVVHNLIWEGLNHYPILLDTTPLTNEKEEEADCKFELFWTKEDEFEGVVRKAWDETSVGYDNWLDRLKAFGLMFKDWSDKKFGCILAKANDLRKKFQDLCKAAPPARICIIYGALRRS